MVNCELVYMPNVTNLEGPVWDKERKSIWTVGIEEGNVFWISESGELCREYNLGSQVGCIALLGDSFIAATYDGLFRVDIETGEKEFITQLLRNNTLRFNDGKMDAKGRFLLGTTGYMRFAPKENSLISWDGTGSRVLIEGTSISNGLAFSEDTKWLYFVDTPTKRVDRYRYEIETGEVTYMDSPIYIDGAGLPDGICLDLDGCIWVAEWGGGRVRKWNPENGKCVGEISLPVKNVSSCCIGGQNKNYIYITTAKRDDGSESEEFAGGLFCVEIR